MEKYCPSCGKRTFYEGNDSDYYAGDEYVCYSCGFSAHMSVSEPIEYTADKGKVEQYQPLKSDVEVIAEHIYSRLIFNAFGRSVFDEKWQKDAAAYSGEKITFRRYEPFPPHLEA